VGLERGPLSLMSTTEELLERKSSGSGLENRDYGRRGSYATPLYPQKLALSLPTSGGRSVGTARSRTQATEFFFQYPEFRADLEANGSRVTDVTIPPASWKA
jgi:hypothetical protein